MENPFTTLTSFNSWRGNLEEELYKFVQQMINQEFLEKEKISLKEILRAKYKKDIFRLKKNI